MFPTDLALLIFDLDGTLIDSRDDLVASVNAMLAHLGRPALSAEVVANYVGDGATVLVQRALGLLPPPESEREEEPATAREGESEWLTRRGLDFFLGHYAEHKLDGTRLYAGVAAGLAALAAAGYRMAVLTNKPVRPSQAIVEGLGIAGYFRAVYGGNSFPTKKPDPQGLRVLLSESGVGPRAAAMIGDTHVDVRTGRNAGTWTMGVTYGFAPASLQLHPPDWTFDSFAELSTRLLGK